MEKLDILTKKSVTALNFVSCILLFGVMVFIVLYIVLRGMFGIIIFASYEIVQYICLFVVCCALAGNDYKEGNVKVTVLTDMIPKKWRVIPEAFSLIFSCAICIASTFFLYNFFLSRLAMNTLTLNLKMPIWIFSLVLFISFILLSFSVVVRTLKYFTSYKPKQQADEDTIAL